mmetsp:Transcript_25977/g.61778  ORF Transcript_25977/g.61778 Transcript_25977/m.61778 type:complete len:355 (-) Transcript_25977:594-1658(-)
MLCSSSRTCRFSSSARASCSETTLWSRCRSFRRLWTSFISALTWTSFISAAALLSPVTVVASSPSPPLLPWPCSPPSCCSERWLRRALTSLAALRSPRLLSVASDPRLRGSVTVKVVPLPRPPNCDSTLMLPPCASTSPRTSDKPRPVPPYRCVVATSTCWNEPQIASSRSCGMPGPVSETETKSGPAGFPSLSWASIVIWPLAVTLRLFAQRFINTCVNLSGSPWIAGMCWLMWLRISTPGLTSGLMTSITVSAISFMSHGCTLTTSRDLREEAASRMSLTKHDSRCPVRLMMLRVRFVLASAQSPWSSASASPMMPFSGVRSSCEICAKASSWARFAASRFCWVCCSCVTSS